MNDKKDLTKTRALTELNNIASKEEEQDLPGVDNPEFIEGEEITNEYTIHPEDDIKNKKDKKDKESLISKFKKLPNKTKILIIAGSIVLILVIIFLIIFFVLKSKPPKEEPKPQPDVIFTANNYTYKNGTLTVYDKEKNTIGEYECNNKNEDTCYVAYYDNTLDEFNTLLIYQEEDIYRERSTNYGNLMFIYDDEEEKDGEIKLYNLKNKEVLGTYTSVKRINNELVIVKEKDKYKVISLTNDTIKTVIDDNYTYLAYTDEFKIDALVAGKNGSYYLLDFTGKKITSDVSNNIVMYTDKYLVLKNSDAYHVVDYEGNEVISDTEYALLYDKFLITVENQKLYIKNYENKPYNIEGIKLSSRNYRSVKKYDKDSNLISEEDAFTIDYKGNSVTVKLKDTEKKINLLEGEVSNDKKYYSYYDGKLYFYSDEDKTTLLGSYTCTNKNEITGIDKEFNSCNIAMQSNFSDNYKTSNVSEGMAPIFYNRFVFVTDNNILTSDDAKIIYLYDLKNNKKLGSYRAIDTGLKEFGLVNTDTNILAKNTEGKYGMITLKNNGVSATYRSDYNFKVDKMERFGKEVIVSKDGKWELLSTDGTAKGGFSGKILDYLNNYYVIADNNKVRLYNLEGLKDIGTTTYDYLKLTNNFYLYVNNNKIGVKTYKGENLLFEDNSLTKDISITNYLTGLRISIIGTTATLNIVDESGNTLATYRFSTTGYTNSGESSVPVEDLEE